MNHVPIIFRKILHRFWIFTLNSYSQKSLRNTNKIVCFFSRDFLFAGNPNQNHIYEFIVLTQQEGERLGPGQGHPWDSPRPSIFQKISNFTKYLVIWDITIKIFGYGYPASCPLFQACVKKRPLVLWRYHISSTFVMSHPHYSLFPTYLIHIC